MKNDNHVWDNKHPTAQMLGRWQPWHAGHQKLFEETLKKPMIEKKRSLNLATSVAIVLSENLRQTDYLWTK